MKKIRNSRQNQSFQFVKTLFYVNRELCARMSCGQSFCHNSVATTKSLKHVTILQKKMDVDHNDNRDASSTTSGDAESGTGGSRSARSEDTGDIQEALIKSEEKAVRKAKCLVGFSVLLCAIAVLLSVFFLTAQSDRRSFELAVSTNHT